ncbi:MAG: DUF4395 family protein, partial [Gemmatimonadetes bacterium]|nr:DUF4395 family protein [Gemmatimonadota bacterium]
TKRLHGLDVQGLDTVDEERLAEVAPWLRLSFGLCATLAIVATALASTPLLFALAAIAFLAGVLPVHPFDLIYNHGVRHATKTPPLPRRGPPARFACGVGALWLIVTVGAFDASWTTVGYVLGFTLAGVAILVSTMDICIPSMIFRAIFGPPLARTASEDVSGGEVGRPPMNRRDRDRLYRT